MRAVLVTGANGFLGRNAMDRLERSGGYRGLPIVRNSTPAQWDAAIAEADAILHLAGVTQSEDAEAVRSGNLGTTERIVDALRSLGRKVPIVFSSTTKFPDETAYGRSKKEAEDLLLRFAAAEALPLAIYRLPHVFGRWARTHHNSIVVTMCADQANGRAFDIRNPDAMLTLAYVDDVVDGFIASLEAPPPVPAFVPVEPIYRIRLGDVAEIIATMAPDQGPQPRDGTDPRLLSALHATYRSFLAPDELRRSKAAVSR